MDTKDKIKSIAKEEIVASCVRTLKRVAEISEDELKKFLLEELPKVLTDLGTSLDICLDKLSEVKSHYPPPSPPRRAVLVPLPIGPEMTVRELWKMVKAVLERPAIPEKFKEKLQVILGFLDEVINAKELGQIRGFEEV